MKKVPGVRRLYLQFFNTCAGKASVQIAAALLGRRPDSRSFRLWLAERAHGTLYEPTWLLRDIGACLVAWTIGSIGALLYLLLLLTGRIRVHGWARLMRGVSGGRVIIAANHPSLLDPVVIPFLLEPLLHLYPPRYLLWSVPDVKTYGLPRWIYRATRCIEVDRENKRFSARSFKPTSRDILANRRGVLAMHPEVGRTSSPHTDLLPPGPCGRRMRRIESAVPKAALETGATILPVWIEGTDEVLPRGARVPRFWRTVRVYIGRPYDPAALERQGLTQETQNRHLERAILEAGVGQP